MRSRLLIWVVFLLAGCSGGAVVFAPTPAPADVSPLVYTHPSGAFSITLPRNWSVYVQNTTVLAAAAFAPTNDDQPAIHAAVMNTGKHLDSTEFSALIDQYQTQTRPDSRLYQEVSRQAMGDGSWRLSGLRHTAGGETQPVNTFIQQSDTRIGLIEVDLPADSANMAELQNIINTFVIHSDAPLETAEPDVLASATSEALDILHVSAWTTPAGVLFITGEVANRGAALVTDIPVRAVLYTSDGRAIAEAVDTVMGYGLPPGEFAPFSLRFGQGQPALTMTYSISLGSETWTSEPDRVVFGRDEVTWSDQSSVEADGHLVITGEAVNRSDKTVYAPRAVATVFDSSGNVIAAGYQDIGPALTVGQTSAFRLDIPELGGQPANYILNIQGIP